MDSPKIGVGVAVIKNGKLLMGKRLKEPGSGTYSLPGGHVEMFETLEACAIREVKEETGLDIECVEIVTFTENIWKEHGKHYITCWLIAETEGEPVNTEPEKCDGWDWYGFDDIPSPLFELKPEVFRLIRSKGRDWYGVKYLKASLPKAFQEEL